MMITISPYVAKHDVVDRRRRRIDEDLPHRAQLDLDAVVGRGLPPSVARRAHVGLRAPLGRGERRVAHRAYLEVLHPPLALDADWAIERRRRREREGRARDDERQGDAPLAGEKEGRRGCERHVVDRELAQSFREERQRVGRVGSEEERTTPGRSTGAHGRRGR